MSDDREAWRHLCARAAGWIMWALTGLLISGAFVGCIVLREQAL